MRDGGALRLVAVAALLASPLAGAAHPGDPTLPAADLTPGVIDPAVGGADICDHDWAPGSPPVKGGSLTYSQAARDTSRALKQHAFEAYGIADPRDRGQSYEIDHRVPLSLGGRDVLGNLWPETRDRSERWNAWVKDRLEQELFDRLCRPAADRAPITLADAQAAFLGDWTVAYQRYCVTEHDCGTGAASAPTQEVAPGQTAPQTTPFPGPQASEPARSGARATALLEALAALGLGVVFVILLFGRRRRRR